MSQYTRYPAAPAGGAVTSVGVTAPNIFTVAGSPVTTAGTISLGLATETANLIWAGPASGAAAAPTFRSLVLGDIPSLQVNQNLYVDGQRTDTYTADGSPQRPFKTINAAISQIVTNANNATKPYTILVCPGTYSEDLLFNNAALYNITITSMSGASTPIQNTSVVNGLTSTSNNTQLANLVFNGITFGGAINLTGSTNGTNFASTQVLFANCQFNNSASTIVLNNINNVNFYSCQIQGSGSVATFTNVAFGYIEGSEGFIGGTTLHLVDNPGGNTPSQYSGNYLLLSETKFYGTLTVDAGSELDVLMSYFGTTSSLTNNGTLHSWGTNWGGSAPIVLNSGSTYRNRGDIFYTSPTVNSGATIQNQDTPYMLAGVFGSSAMSATNAAVVTKDGHLKSTQTTAPTAAPASAGSGASASVAHATDNAGSLTLNTGSGTITTAATATVTFNKAYNTAPIVTITPSNSNAGALAGVYITSGTGSFVINFSTAPAASTTYSWFYTVVETQ